MNKQLSLDLEEVKSWVDRNMPQLLDDLIRISRIPSIAEVHGTEYPPFGKACRDVLDETLQIGREYGFQTQNYEYYVGRVSYGDQEEAIGIWSHLDVVETEDGWVYPPYEPTIRDGYMIARGCQDNKSSAAMALHVMRYLKEHQITLTHTWEPAKKRACTTLIIIRHIMNVRGCPLFLIVGFRFATESVEVSMVS